MRLAQPRTAAALPGGAPPELASPFGNDLADELGEVLAQPLPLALPAALPTLAAPRVQANDATLALLTVLGFTAVRLFVLATVPLGNGEAYYFTWSRFLDWSYYDHPPMVAWMAWLTTRFGDSPAMVRLGPVLCAGLFDLLVYRLALRFGSRRAAYFALLLVSAGPVFVFTGFVLNPEATLLPLFVGFLLTIESMRSHDEPWRPLLAGAFLGVAFLSKYSGLLLLPATLLYFALSPQMRHWYRRWSFYGAGLVALVLASPVLYWNATRGWPSLMLHLVERGRTTVPVPGENPFNSLVSTVSNAGTSLTDSLQRVFTGQFFSFSPFLAPMLAVGLFVALRRARRNDDALFLAVFGWAIMTPLLLAQIAIKDSEPHWTMMAFVPAAVMTGGLLDGVSRWAKWGRLSLWVGMVASSLVLVLASFHARSTLLLQAVPKASYEPRADMVNELLGWDVLRPALQRTVAEFEAQGAQRVVLASNHYSLCGRLFYEMNDTPEVYCPTARRSQFDFLDRRVPPAAATVLLVTTDIHEALPEDLADRGCILNRTVPFVRAGITVADYHLYQCPARP